MPIGEGVGQKEYHFGIVTRNTDPSLGPELRGAVFFSSDTLTNGTEYSEPAQPSFQLAGKNGEGFFWVPQVGDQIEIEIDKADEHPVPRYTRMLYSSEDEIAEEFSENYPFRMGWKTRAGHILLFDNFIDALFVRFSHSIGTGFEWNHDGDEIKTVFRNLVETIQGEIQRTVELKVSEIFKAEVLKEVTGKVTETFKNDVVREIQGQLKETIKNDRNLTVSGNNKITVQGNCQIEASGNVEVMGSQIQLNGSGGSVVTTGTDPLVDNITGAPHIGVPTVLSGRMRMGMQASYKCIKCDKDCFIDPGPPLWESLRDRKNTSSESTKKLKKQCHRTGKIFEVDVPVIETDELRAIPLSLRVGHETISTTICSSCIDSVRPEFTQFWNVIEGLVGLAPEKMEES